MQARWRATCAHRPLPGGSHPATAGDDNAPLESFPGTSRTARRYRDRFATRTPARQAIPEEVELFYPRHRLQAGLDDLSAGGPHRPILL